MKTITYAIDRTNGQVYSNVGNEIAVPVLDFANMTAENNYQASYQLEKVRVFSLAYYWDNLIWTRKISREIKNWHRKFWGMKELK